MESTKRWRKKKKEEVSEQRKNRGDRMTRGFMFGTISHKVHLSPSHLYRQRRPFLSCCCCWWWVCRFGRKISSILISTSSSSRPGGSPERVADSFSLLSLSKSFAQGIGPAELSVRNPLPLSHSLSLSPHWGNQFKAISSRISWWLFFHSLCRRLFTCCYCYVFPILIYRGSHPYSSWPSLDGELIGNTFFYIAGKVQQQQQQLSLSPNVRLVFSLMKE